MDIKEDEGSTMVGEVMDGPVTSPKEEEKSTEDNPVIGLSKSDIDAIQDTLSQWKTSFEEGIGTTDGIQVMQAVASLYNKYFKQL